MLLKFPEVVFESVVFNLFPPLLSSSKFSIVLQVIRCGSSSNTHAGVVSGNVGNTNENWQMIRVGSFSIDYKISDVPSGI
ncbi:hypothetical protein ACFX13_033784 [Malus domestica]